MKSEKYEKLFTIYNTHNKHSTADALQHRNRQRRFRKRYVGNGGNENPIATGYDCHDMRRWTIRGGTSDADDIPQPSGWTVRTWRIECG